jgi:hypothetical protein
MPVRVFVSTENSAHDRARRFIDGLREAGLQVTCSPLNPALGDDPRWRDWYETGCSATIEATDVFVAVVTAGYDCSTWMAIEFETAWEANQANGRPRLFVLHQTARPLPAGFRQYEEAATLLPFDVNEAVAFLVERVPPVAEDEPRVLCTVGGPVDEVGVCVAVYGEDLDPAEVSALLGCTPTSSHRRGDRRGPRSPLYKRGAWLLEVRGTAPEGPEELVAKLLGQLPSDEGVWLKMGERYEVQLRLGIHMTGWNRGFDLSAALVGKVVRLHAKMGFDIYAYGGEDEPGDAKREAPQA